MVQRISSGSFTAGIETGRLGGSTRAGSEAYYRKGYTKSAREDMANIISKYSTLINRLKSATPEIMREVLEPVFDKSQIYVPVKTGALKASGRLTVGTGIGGRVTANINYGSSGTKYAALVHERMEVHHNPPTRAKYLQSAMEEEYSGMLAHLAVLYAGRMG